MWVEWRMWIMFLKDLKPGVLFRADCVVDVKTDMYRDGDSGKWIGVAVITSGDYDNGEIGWFGEILEVEEVKL
jgi:hypothetical protein